MIIHRCNYADQINIQIACTALWHTPRVETDQALPSEVYVTLDGVLYSFEKAPVTCPRCREVASEG